MRILPSILRINSFARFHSAYSFLSFRTLSLAQNALTS